MASDSREKNTFTAGFENAQGRRYRIRVIEAGLSGNGNFYPTATLKAGVALFDGVRVFVKSDSEHLRGGGKDVRNLIGRLESPSFISGAMPDDGEIQADLVLIQPDDAIGQKLLEAFKAGLTNLFGFSIDAVGISGPGMHNGQRVAMCKQFKEVLSVDLIVEPGAGGRLINLIESKGSSIMENLTSLEIDLIIKTSGLPEVAQQRLATLHKGAELSETTLRESINNERKYLANFTESGRVKGLGDETWPVIKSGDDQRTPGEKMLDAFFDPSDNSVISIRECYLQITGDRSFSGLTRNCDHTRLRESLASASFADVLGASMSRRMVANYKQQTVFDVWRDLVTIVPVKDFRTQERVRFGGYGDLPAVAEGAPYVALSSPTDEKASYAISKRGGTEDITLEMITNDDVGAVNAIPNKMIRAAKRTLSKFVLDHLRTNPVIYDTKTLFHADHGNLGTAALSSAAIGAGRAAMKNQAEMDSNDKLGIGPRFLWVPDQLEETAYNLFRRETNLDSDFIQSLQIQVRPVWYWTDANDWCLSADKFDIPSIELGFLAGKEEPEVFVQDLPSSGSLFTHDKVTYKIRHIYGAAVTDYRGLYKAVVPAP